MRTQIRSSDPEDPLEGYSGLTLFPRTLAPIPNSPKPYDADDLHRLHSFLKSMPLGSPNKLLGQAKAIVDSSSGLSSSEISSSVKSKDKKKVIAAKVKENPQGRTPGLGRRRNRLSMMPKSSVEPNLDFDKLKDQEQFFAALEKHENAQMDDVLLEVNQQNPTTAAKTRRQGAGRRPATYKHRHSNAMLSQEILKDNLPTQPTVNVKPILDIDKLKDPEDFFSALEKQENAERELQKQRGGGLLDFNTRIPSMPRSRRQGMSRKSVRNKYHYSNEMSSQETLIENVPGPSDCGVQRETTDPDVSSKEKELSHDELQEMELDGSIAKMENRVSGLLDELLPKNCEELDRDGAVSLLKEHLQFEPIDVEKSWLPEFKDVPRIDLRAVGAKLPKPRNSLSDIQNMLHGISTQMQKKHSQAESSVPCLASPTPPRNPIISLKKLQSDPKKRCFSFSELDFDQSPPRNASPPESVTKQTEVVNMEKDLTIPFKINSPMIEENDIAHVNMSLPDVAIGLTSSSDKTGKDNFNRLGSGIDIGSSGFHVDFEDNFGGSDMDNMVLDEVVGMLDTDAEVQTNEPNELDKMKDMQQDEVGSVQPDVDDDVGSSGLQADLEDNIGRSHVDNVVANTVVGRLDTDTEVQTNEPNEADKMKDMQPDEVGSVQPDVDVDVGSSGLQADLEDNIGRSHVDNVVVNTVVGRLDTDTEVQTNEPNEADKMKDMQPDEVGSVQPDVDVDVGSSGLQADLEDNIGRSHVDNVVANTVVGRLDTDTEVQTNEPNEADKMKDMQPDEVGSVQPDVDVGSSGLQADLEDNIGRSHVDNVVVNTVVGRLDTDTEVQTNEPNEADKMKDMQPDEVGSVQPDVDVDVGSSGLQADLEDNIGRSHVDNVVANTVVGRLDTDTEVQTNEPNEADKMKDMQPDEVGSVQPDVDVGSSGLQADLEDNIGRSHVDNVVVNTVVGRLDTDTEVQTNEPNEADKMKDIHQEAVEPDLNMEDSNVENLNSTQSHLVFVLAPTDQAAVVEDHAMDGPSNTADTSPEQHKEEPQISTRVSSIVESEERPHPHKKGKRQQTTVPLNEQSEEISCTRRKGNHEGTRVIQNERSEEISRPPKKGRRDRVILRPSLTGCGSSWDAGRRRSTRYKCRPLEYDKGEKLLYAHIKGIIRVIGRKYLYLSEDTGIPVLKVESFVSDEYKDLVEDAARH